MRFETGTAQAVREAVQLAKLSPDQISAVSERVAHGPACSRTMSNVEGFRYCGPPEPRVR